MKHLCQKVLPGLLLAVLLVLPAAAQPRIGIVDLRKVFDNYHEKAQADITISNNAEGLTRDFKAGVEAYDKLKAECDKLRAAQNDQTVSAAEREKRGNATLAKLDEIKAAERGLQEMQAEANKKLDALKTELLAKILKQIRVVIDALAKAEGYTLVLDSTADSLNQAPVVLYTNGENDLTDKVLATLNAASPAAAITPPAGGGTPRK
jgi:outer membrane protein